MSLGTWESISPAQSKIYKTNRCIMTTDALCNGRTPSLPSLEVARKVQKSFIHMPCMNWLLHFHYARQDFESCKFLIKQQLTDFVNLEYVYFVKGLIERQEGNYFEALRDFQRAVDANPNNIEIYKEIGKTLYVMGRFKQALGIFREAESLSTRPDHEVFHYIGELLFRAALQNGNLMEDAKDYFQKAVTYGKKLESYQKLAEIYRQEKDYTKAVETLENSLQIAPESTEVLTEVGVLYLKINDTQRAFDKLQEVTSVNDKCPRGLFAFGAILQCRNDIDGSLGKYKQITDERANNAELWNNIGLCFFKKNKLIVALACLKKSIWMSPLNYNSLYNLSLVFITAHQYASAFHTLASAINLRKDSAECYMLLGICLRKLEDYENAYIAFERAAMSPDALKNPLIYLNFALFCYETGRIEKAAINFNNFARISQDSLLPTEYKFSATKLKALLQVTEIEKLETTQPDKMRPNADNVAVGGGEDLNVQEQKNSSAISSNNKRNEKRKGRTNLTETSADEEEFAEALV